MAPRPLTDAPQISFTSWILGGDLISKRNRPPKLPTVQPPIDSEPKSKKEDKTKKATIETTGGGEVLLEGFDGFALNIENATAPAVEATKVTITTADSVTEIDKRAWTAKQDADILSMKADSKSWKVISAAVGASKKDVQVRFKELSEKKGGSAGSGSEGAVEGAGQTVEAKEGNQGGVKCHEDKEKQKSGNEKRNKEEKKGRLKADNIWTREDCEVLEMLEARYTEQKWLQMQAGFYNMTGRMVIAEMIERKFSEED